MMNFPEETVRLSSPNSKSVAYNEESNGNVVHPSIVSTYQALLSLTSDLCCIMHIDGSILRVNASFLKISGYVEEEILHRPWIDFIHPQHTKASQRLFHTGSKSDKKPTSVIYRFRKKNGRYMWLKSNSSTLPGKGQEMCILICSQDITKEKKISQLIDNQHKELVQYKAELENFTYLASHDLQEPLRVISSYLQLLKKRYQSQLDQSGIDFINFSSDGAGRMNTMIQDLLEYSRVSRRYQHEEMVDTNKVLKGIQHRLRHEIQANNVKINTYQLPIVTFNKPLMVRLWYNLISNAIKFQPEHNGTIDIRVKEYTKHWVIAIEDNGIGIEKKYYQRIFEPFEKLHGRLYPGSGMGLPIAKKIIERYGGRIWIKSKVGVGTTLSFTLLKA